MSEKKINPLVNKKVLVKYKMRHKNGVTQKNHPLYGNMLDVAVIVFYVKKNQSNGSYIDPFTPEEREFVASALGIDSKRLSPHYKGDDNYWKDYTVRLGKSGTVLNLSDLEDFIKYKVLLTNNGLIAKSFEESNRKPSYRFYMVDEENEIKVKSKGINARKEAYISYGKIDNNQDKLAYVIWQMTKQIPARNSKIDVLQAKMMEGDMLETRAETFNKIMKDKLFEYKVLIYRGLVSGVISRKNEEYYMDGTLIANGSMSGNLENTAQFISDPANQEKKFLIEDRIKQAKE